MHYRMRQDKKRIAVKGRGVTLLEIMLVLAIAAMIIVMSVRYYQSATASTSCKCVLTVSASRGCCDE